MVAPNRLLKAISMVLCLGISLCAMAQEAQGGKENSGSGQGATYSLETTDGKTYRGWPIEIHSGVSLRFRLLNGQELELAESRVARLIRVEPVSTMAKEERGALGFLARFGIMNLYESASMFEPFYDYVPTWTIFFPYSPGAFAGLAFHAFPFMDLELGLAVACVASISLGAQVKLDFFLPGREDGGPFLRLGGGFYPFNYHAQRFGIYFYGDLEFMCGWRWRLWNSPWRLCSGIGAGLPGLVRLELCSLEWRP